MRPNQPNHWKPASRKTIQLAADEFRNDYATKHRSATWAEYVLEHVSRQLGVSLVMEIRLSIVDQYQADRLKENAGPKSIR